MSDSPSFGNEPSVRPELAGIDQAEIRRELERIVASPLFHQAEQPIHLLRFIVECTLNGDGAPKEYRLAVEALGRGPEFDPRNDTIVRVQVRKLRAKLAKYYETEGASDPVVIDLPVGLYVARFCKNTLTNKSGKGPSRRHSRYGRRALQIGAVLLVCAIPPAALFVPRWFRSAPPPVDAPRLTRLTWGRNLYLDPALSADGKKLIYAADGGKGNPDLWVQGTGGEEPIQITSDSMNHQEPVISPDGRRVAFRSDRENVGLWELTVGSSNPPRRFSKEGRHPRFSPDGTQLTFWVPGIPNSPDEPLSPLFFAPHSSVRALQHGTIFCTDPNTLKVRLLPLTLAAAGLPSWSPDGQYVVVYGASEIVPFRQEDADWWVAPTATTVTAVKPVRTGIVSQLRRIGVEPVLSPPCWVGDKLYFSAASGETVDLWEATLSERTHQVEGSIRKVSLGDGAALSPTASASGKLAFSIVSGDVNLWTLPVRANLGVPSGKLQRLTAGASPKFWSSVSADGAQVAFASQRFGSINLFVKDLRTGAERRVASAAEAPRMSPNGSKIVFSRPAQGTAAILVVSTGGGDLLEILKDGGEVTGWSADGRYVLHDRGAHLHGHRLDIDAKKDSEFSRHPVEDSYAQSLSPDQKWVALICRSRLYLAAIPGEAAAADDQWIQVTDGSDSVERARWSPDGNLLYFVSNRDGHRCIWAQRLAPGSRKPEGSALAVWHFHGSGPSMDHLAPEVVSLDVSADKLVFVLGEFNSTVFQLSR